MKELSALFSALALVAMTAVNSFAVNADIDALFAAVDITSVKGNVVTLLTSFVVISTIFLGIRYLRKSMSQGR